MVQDVGLRTANDQEILKWAATHNYILLTHDQATIPVFAYERVGDGVPMPGVFIINDNLSLRQAIDELLFLDYYSEQDEWNNLVVYLPL